MLERTSPLRLAWFDQEYRRLRRWWTDGPTRDWNHVQLAAQECLSVVALASFHESGFVRERAVWRLSDFDDGFELPFLLIRANDWTAKVQQLALTAVTMRIVPAYGEHWLRSLVLVERLRHTDRRAHDLRELSARVDALLLQPELRGILSSALSTGEVALRRECLRLALQLPLSEARPLLRPAMADPDPVVATRSAQALLANVSSNDEVLSAALGHPLARVRRLALESAARSDRVASVSLLQSALLDETRSVREVARYELSKPPTVCADFTALYAKAVREHSGRKQRAAFEGLAEAGSREALETFVEFLRHPRAKMRAAAIVGLARYDGSNRLDELQAAMRDPSPIVRRAVREYARRYLGRGAI